MKEKIKRPKLKFSGKAKELLCLNSYITVIDNSKVIVENCRQIAECNEFFARVITSGFQVEIKGNGLALCSYCNNAVEVIGTVEGISLSERKRTVK